MSKACEDLLTELASRGIAIPDPRQVYIAPEVNLERISSGAVLHPGTRLIGARTFVGAGSQVGTEGPAMLDDAVIADGAEIASGYVKGSVLLSGARLGSNAHVRAGTLLEEYASTAHAVGLKQTILMAFVTLGSLINLCDALVSGGRSKKDHSEIGSGFIHFNFTPFGESGDKATPSLIGDVVRGIFLREDRIFLGGLSGLVGPNRIGFGAMTVAGQVIRTDVAEGTLYGSTGFEINKPFSRQRKSPPDKVFNRNVDYIRQLFALRAWYVQVRLARVPESPSYQGLRIVLTEAISTIDECIEERISRLNSLRSAFRYSPLAFEPHVLDSPLPVSPDRSVADHLAWLRALSESDVRKGQDWLASVAQSVGVHELRTPEADCR